MRNIRSLLLLGVVVAGCGDDPIAIKDLPGDILDARCNRDVACANDPDTATCQASHTGATDNESLTLFADVDAGVIKYDAGAAAACLGEFKSSCTFAGLHTAPDVSACDGVFTGTVATGGACEINQECAGHAVCTQTDTACNRNTACCAGTCSADVPQPTVVAIGGACDGNTKVCANQTAYCKIASGTQSGTCTALVTGAGTACDVFDACANPLYCDTSGSGSGSSGTCKKAAATGEACMQDAGISCADGRDYCNAAMKCTRLPTVGEACPDGACVGFATCESAVCVARPGAGDACVVGAQASCLGNLTCTNGTCKLPPAGMSCKT